jgi:hypothetical protein
MGEVETSCGCGDRSISLRENGLITLPVQGFVPSLDVRGERDMADFPKDIRYLTVAGKANLSFSSLHLFYFSLKSRLKLDSTPPLYLP